MSNEIASFQERVFERIKGQIGDLIGPEEARKLVDTAIQKSFFEERVTSRQYGHDERKPSVFVELVQAQARPLIEQAVKVWIQEHEAEIVQATKEQMAAGFAKFIGAMIASMVSQNSYTLINELQAKGLLPR